MPYWVVMGLPDRIEPKVTPPPLSFRVYRSEEEARHADPRDHSAIVYAMDAASATTAAYRAKGLRLPG